MEEDTKAFLRFYEANKDKPFKVEGGVAMTIGCDGRFGTCCSRSYDIEDLVDALRELLGEAKST